ncbi:hypothetical protein DFJ74DRAFT_713264 [Hyaloraphidium curvatum]|nr:hypothetical protein DFJ74DRAFT_713264 [Hyaloraphidium curvatum]
MAASRADQIASHLGASPLKSRLLFRMSLKTGAVPTTAVGKNPNGTRFIATVDGGTVEGLVNGKVVGPAADWVLVRGDGSNGIDVRLTIVTEDNEAIYMTYTGVLVGKKAHAELVAKGALEDAEPVRTAVRFETASEKHAFLNTTVAVGRGKTVPGGVIYEVFGIL